jgi:hypothetical protein
MMFDASANCLLGEARQAVERTVDKTMPHGSQTERERYWKGGPRCMLG